MCECREDGYCGDPVSNGESWVARQRHMEDSSVGLQRLLGSEVTRNRRVSAQRHCDGGRG